MCGRIVLTYPLEALARLFAAAPDNDLPVIPNYNICPTDQIHAVISSDGVRRLRSLRWGFVPVWAKGLTDGPPLINARAESVADKPAFRAAARTQRCLIPVTGYYEWTKDDHGNRLPWYMSPDTGAPLGVAGIWQNWRSGDTVVATCAILTCAANARLSGIHHRMPVILAAPDWPLWLGEAGHGAARLMRPAPDDLLGCVRVDRAVNSNRAQGAELIQPLEI